MPDRLGLNITEIANDAPEMKKYPMSSSSLSQNAMLMPKIRAE